MKTIIIDGYNAIHATPALVRELRESLDAARKALASHVSRWSRRYPDADVRIVFDGTGPADLDPPRRTLNGVDCRFTADGERADERIVSMVRDSDHPSRLIVVSNDNAVRHSCRAHGARVEYADFIAAAP